MSKELDELKKRMKSRRDNLDFDMKFNEYSKMYSRSNENLKEYVKNLEGKKVLCVASSGDHLLNSVYAGATQVDTFDINRYTALYQELNIYAVKNLEPVKAYVFLCQFYPDIYWEFNNMLPPHLKEFFDCLFTEYDIDQIKSKLFNGFNSSLENCNYNSLDALKVLGSRLPNIKHNHFICNLYSITSYIKDKYDVIYLSNILEYEKDFNKYFDIIRRLKEFYLNEGGEIYYNYLWAKSEDEDIRSCFWYSPNKYITYEDIQANKDIINTTKKVSIPSVYKYTDENGIPLPDLVLKVRKPVPKQKK